MKRILIALFMITCLSPLVTAQRSIQSQQKERTIVFLMPLNSANIGQSKSADMEDSKDIERTFSRSVIGFWCGAQIALNELAEQGRNLKVIAREINNNDSAKLEQVFAEEEVKHADLIFAPVPKDIFPMVARHAKSLRIPVVNPLSPNGDIIDGNPYVYKMRSHTDAKAATLVEQFPGAHFIIWGNLHADIYENYFKAQNIPYEIIDEESSFTARLQHDSVNVVIACPAHTNAYAQVANALVIRSRMPEFHWVLPESLLNNSGFDLKVLSPFNIYFLTDFFADDESENCQVFRDTYVRTYNTLPTVKNFAYQGYDATYFFTELICNDFHIPKDFSPLSCYLKFRRPDKANGFENYGIRLVQLHHLQYNIIK